MNEVMESPTDSPTKKKGEKKLKRQSSEKVKKEKKKSSTDYLQRGEEEETKTREEKERERAERKKRKEEKRKKEEMKESGEKSSKKTEGGENLAEDEEGAKIEIETKKIEELKRRIEEKKREEEEDEKERKERLKFEALTKRNSRIINDVNDVVDDNFSEPEVMSEDEVLPESKKPIQNDVVKVVSFEVKKVDQAPSQKKQSTNSVSLTDDVTRGQEEVEPINKDTVKNTAKVEKVVEKPVEKDIASCPPLEEAKQKLKIYIPKEGSTQPPPQQAQTKSTPINEKERPQYRPMSPLKPVPQAEELPDYFEVTPEMSAEEAEAVKRRLERAQRRTNRANSVGSINFPAPPLKDFSKTSASTSLSSMDSVTSPTNSVSTTPNTGYKRFSFSGPSSSHYSPENLPVTKSLSYNYHAPSPAQTGNYYRGPTSGCSAGPSSSYYSSTAKPPPGPPTLDSPQTAQLYGDIKERVSSWHHGYMKRERARQKEQQENDELTRAIEKERNLGTSAPQQQQQQQPRKMSLFEEAEKQKKEKEQAKKMESEELEREQRMMARQQERLQRQMERIEKQGAERPLSEISQDSPDTLSPTNSYRSSTSTPTTTPISSNKDEVSVTHTSLYTRDEINSPSNDNSVFTSMYVKDEYVKRPLSTFRRTVPKV